MASLVLEVQADALNQACPVSVLLRKALAVAAKLNLPAVDAWLVSELNGYPRELPAPSHRRVDAMVVVRNPFHGWQPLRIADPEVAKQLNKAPLYQGAAELEHHLLEHRDGGLLVTLSPELEAIMHRGMEHRFPLAFNITSGAVAGILGHVRTAVLQWALDLEARGITGTGLSFSQEEKQTARSEPTVQNINIYGPASQVQFAQGAHAPVQNNTNTVDLNIEHLNQIVADVRRSVEALDLPQAVREEAHADLVTIEQQLKKKTPDLGIVNKSAQTLIRGLGVVGTTGQAIEYAQKLIAFLAPFVGG